MTTGDFVAELERQNPHWTPKRANSRIDNQVSYFREITPDFSEIRFSACLTLISVQLQSVKFPDAVL